MGFNTVIMVLNDAWHQVRENPEKFVEDIQSKMNMEEPFYGDKYVHFGNEVQVDQTFHASDSHLYLAGGNWLMPLDEHEIEILMARDQYDLIERQIEQAQKMLDEVKKHYNQRLEQANPLLHKAKKALKKSAYIKNVSSKS